MQMNTATTDGTNHTMFISAIYSGVGTITGVNANPKIFPNPGNNDIRAVDTVRSVSPNQF